MNKSSAGTRVVVPAAGLLVLSVAQWAPWLAAGPLPESAQAAGAVAGAALFVAVAVGSRRAVLGSDGSYGLVGDRAWRHRLGVGVALAAAVYVAAFAARAAVSALTVDGFARAGDAAATVLVGAVVAGYQAVSEEVVFRGALLAVLLGTARVPVAVALSVVVFVGFHLPKWESLLHGPYAVHLVLAGTAFAVAYLRTGSLWLSIGLHWGWNLGAYLVLEAHEPVVRLSGSPAYGWTEPAAWLTVAGNAVLLAVAWVWPVGRSPVGGGRAGPPAGVDRDLRGEAAGLGVV